MLLSDVFLGFSSISLFVYFSFIIISYIDIGIIKALNVCRDFFKSQIMH